MPTQKKKGAGVTFYTIPAPFLREINVSELVLISVSDIPSQTWDIPHD